MTEKPIDVSVYIVTYNHENFVRQAIDSVLSQKTNYSFEIIVSDDCSTDRTVEILKEYQVKYPKIITVNVNRTNLGIPRNIFKARCMCKGKYIVLLAGDDYWIDNNKIQFQADFLENNPEYLAICTSMEIRHSGENNALEVLPPRKECDKEFSMLDYSSGKPLYIRGFMMRNEFLSKEGRDYFAVAQKISDKVDDAVDSLLLLKRGRVFVSSRVTDVYRIQRDTSGADNYNSRFDRIERLDHAVSLYNNLYAYFNGKVD